MQSSDKPPRLLKVIRESVHHIEETSGIASDDPAMVELKQNVARTVGDLELAKANRQDEPDKQQDDPDQRQNKPEAT
jgi:hypothetical protein